MWDGVTYVEPTRRPIIHEGMTNAQVVVTNAGPGVVELLVWSKPALNSQVGVGVPDVLMRMPPGNTRSISGPMIGAALADDQSDGVRNLRFAAIAWRVVC
jgi:hypothetical protein